MPRVSDLAGKQWHCIHLTRQEFESGEVEIIQGAFRAAYVSRNGPQGMALFGVWDDAELNYLIYATPITERYFRPILDAYSAKPTGPPRNRQRLECRCGDAGSISMLVC